MQPTLTHEQLKEAIKALREGKGAQKFDEFLKIMEALFLSGKITEMVSMHNDLVKQGQIIIVHNIK